MPEDKSINSTVPCEAGAAADCQHEECGSGRDPEERTVSQKNKELLREKMLDKTLADSFPTSDPPSSIPDPCEDDSLAA